MVKCRDLISLCSTLLHNVCNDKDSSSSFYPVTFVTENESHAVSSTETLSSSETNRAECHPQLPQAAAEDEEVQYF